MYRKKVKKSKCLGFTVIQLLVVIAIIGVLVALLFPVLQTAKDKARIITCVNNTKQIAYCLQSYLDMNDGYYPAYYLL